MPELRHLRVFVAVAQTRNFTRAAERLHLAQQAVSKSVSQLERELGVSLIERTTREVRLTDAGRDLAEDAAGVIAAADVAFARATAAGEGVAGSIAVGVTPPVGPWVVGLVVRRLRRAAPGLSVAIRDLRPGEARAALDQRRVDLALLDAVAIVATGAVTDAELTTVALRGDITLPLLAVRPPGRPAPPARA